MRVRFTNDAQAEVRDHLIANLTHEYQIAQSLLVAPQRVNHPLGPRPPLRFNRGLRPNELFSVGWRDRVRVCGVSHQWFAETMTRNGRPMMLATHAGGGGGGVAAMK